VILGIDTDVLVAWAMAGAPRHAMARRLFEIEIREQEGMLALTPQVVHEFLHVATDPRRFENPLSMKEALHIAGALWDADEVMQVLPTADVLPRTLDFLSTFRLGRKRILDTALALTLNAAGVHRLATFNPDDFRVFAFLEVVSEPGESPH
jgi:predicted nucleic acid-binding protein